MNRHRWNYFVSLLEDLDWTQLRYRCLSIDSPFIFYRPFRGRDALIELGAPVDVHSL